MSKKHKPEPDQPEKKQNELQESGHESLEELQSEQPQIDYKYSCARARQRYVERTTCRLKYCASCRLKRAEVAAEVAELERIQHDYATKIAALS